MTPDGKLHPHDCTALANICAQPGYSVILAIAEREIANMERAVINVSVDDPDHGKKVVAAQAAAHGAARFWKAVSESMEEAIRQAGIKPEAPLTKEQLAVAETAELLDPTDRKGLRIVEAS